LTNFNSHSLGIILKYLTFTTIKPSKMKKLFVLFATVTLLVGVQACKQKTEETTDTATTEMASDSMPAATTEAAAPADTAVHAAVENAVDAAKDAKSAADKAVDASKDAKKAVDKAEKK
jgi:hypothetical protein